eukprot:jgi/Bigna1/70557/fgenesh1_pg.12_\
MIEFNHTGVDKSCVPNEDASGKNQFDDRKLSGLLTDCLDGSDSVRYDAFGKLISILEENGILTSIDCKNLCESQLQWMSNTVYREIYNFDNWQNNLGDVTFPATMLPLSECAQDALLKAATLMMQLYWEAARDKSKLPKHGKYWINHENVWGKLSDEHRKAISALISELDKEYGGVKFFVKLSTRSPKDSMLMTQRKSHLRSTAEKKKTTSILQKSTECKLRKKSSMLANIPRKLRAKISKEFLRQQEIAAANTRTTMTQKEANTEFEYHRLSMANESGLEAIDLLCLSQRIVDDLQDAKRSKTLLKPFSIMNLHLITRPWVEIPRSSELRGFIHDRKLTALSQYYTVDHHYPEIWKDRHEIAKKACEYVKLTLGPKMPMKDAVVDFVWLPKERQLYIIELNPFGKLAGSALFHWTEDWAVLTGEKPFEFKLNPPRTAN